MECDIHLLIQASIFSDSGGCPSSFARTVETPTFHTMASDTLRHVQTVWEELKPRSPLYGLLFQDLQIITATTGLVTARLQLQTIHVNSKGTMHGAISAALVDWAGSMAISSYGVEKNGLSTDIHVSYVSGAKEGDWIEIEGKASRVGGTLAFTTITIYKVVDDAPGPIIATGSHTKFVRQ